MTQPQHSMPSPDRIFDTLGAYQRSAGLKAAIQVDLFTAIAEGADTAAAIAKRLGMAERGIRILCDYMTIVGLLTKSGDRYALQPDAAAFLSKKSPAYIGGAIDFIVSPHLFQNFDRLGDTIRRGGVSADGNTVAGEEQELWVDFARAMAPMMAMPARAIADILQVEKAGAIKVLDIAAGHGMFGLAIAQKNPQAQIVAVDWPGVLAVAAENAKKMGADGRLRQLPGDAFKVDYGTGYDVALVTNFLHHFDVPTNVALLKKVAAALKPGGRVAILEFVPNEDRVSPPAAAGFALTMLAGTPGGDAYTFSQIQKMCEDAGLRGATTHPMPIPQQVIVATK